VPPEETAADPYQTKGMQAASLAMAQIGRPYRYGGHSPEGFDCSGLVMYVYGLVDILLPRTAAEQANRGRSVSLAAAEPGDLIFFKINGSSVSHVGIFVGDSMFIHAPNSGQAVQQERITDAWWRQRLVDVRRIVP
jgi:murein DD-endopeptidase